LLLPADLEIIRCVTDKHFITAEELLLDSLLMAADIFASGFKPSFIIGIWRGGTPVGVAVQEYLRYQGIDTDHIAIRTMAYTGIDQPAPTVAVHGLDYIVESIHADDRLLIVDDVFDTGRSIQAVIRELGARLRHKLPGVIRIACPWYKPARNVTDLTPDYFVHATDAWLIFPHELMGLTPAEIKAGKRDVAKIFDRLKLQPPSR
jgi:hypoxanthine phosphoribosyltransferase